MWRGITGITYTFTEGNGKIRFNHAERGERVDTRRESFSGGGKSLYILDIRRGSQTTRILLT